MPESDAHELSLNEERIVFGRPCPRVVDAEVELLSLALIKERRRAYAGERDGDEKFVVRASSLAS